jgi:hypothetical protein
MKSYSTAHVPAPFKGKHNRRVYGCFDTNTAARMFGYRIHFEKELVSKRTNPHTSQDHKPIHKFAVQALEELTKIYDPQ